MTTYSVRERRRGGWRSGSRARAAVVRAIFPAVVLAATGLSLQGCARRGPAPIAYDDRDCDYCSMRITDRRFGAELVTATGKVHEFDAVECLAAYYVKARGAGGPAAGVQGVYVTDFRKPGTLIPVEQAVFARGAVGGGHSPMGLDFTAYGADADSTIRRATGSAPLHWTDVVRLVQDAGLLGTAHAGMHMTAASRDSAGRGEDAAARRTAVAVAPAADARHLTVSPAGPVRTLSAALAMADSGATITVMPGRYREPNTIRVDKPVTIVGEGGPVLDGQGRQTIMLVLANGVTVRGLDFHDVGTSYVEDRAAIRIAKASGCTIEDNRIDRAFFGIYLAAVTDCRIARNVIEGEQGTEEGSGNGIHLWSSRDVIITDNQVSGERDGIYFEFVRRARVVGNTSQHNLRYGLHFMFSDSCDYQDNTFRENGAGVAVMFTNHVEMIGNRFEHNWGGGAYGLLLKEIYDAHLEGNRFERNTTGLEADGANRLRAVHNAFVENGWAVKLLASTQDGSFTRNDFEGNTFDVATNSVDNNTTRFSGNYWSDYQGYDLDHDGVGDVPFHPVRLFSMIVGQNAPTTILLRSVFVGLLDEAERVLPSLTPETLVDDRPAMRRVK